MSGCEPTPSDEGEWTLTGTKPWCSLADRISHALVTAWVDDSRRGLFAVDLRHPGVQHQPGHAPWAARGLVQVRSTGLEFDQVAALPVGAPGWYLERPGFAWGGIGVAAVWYGGAVAVARRLREASTHREPDQIALAHLGAVDVALDRARAVLVEAASVVDGPRSQPRTRPDSRCGSVRSSPTRWRRCSCAPVTPWVPDRSPPRASTRGG